MLSTVEHCTVGPPVAGNHALRPGEAARRADPRSDLAPPA